MQIASSTDLAIAKAVKNGTLRLVNATSRFGDAFVSIEDNYGVIEIAMSQYDAKKRIKQVTA